MPRVFQRLKVDLRLRSEALVSKRFKFFRNYLSFAGHGGNNAGLTKDAVLLANDALELIELEVDNLLSPHSHSKKEVCLKR